MKYWEIIADHVGKAGWSWGCSSQIDSAGRVLFSQQTRTATMQSDSSALTMNDFYHLYAGSASC
jgi:hypothetical protein